MQCTTKITKSPLYLVVHFWKAYLKHVSSSEFVLMIMLCNVTTTICELVYNKVHKNSVVFCRIVLYAFWLFVQIISTSSGNPAPGIEFGYLLMVIFKSFVNSEITPYIFLSLSLCVCVYKHFLQDATSSKPAYVALLNLWGEKVWQYYPLLINVAYRQRSLLRFYIELKVSG